MGGAGRDVQQRKKNREGVKQLLAMRQGDREGGYCTNLESSKH